MRGQMHPFNGCYLYPGASIFNNMTEKIVLTLTKHPIWGFILQPVLVKENEYGMLAILEYADSKSTGFAQLNELAKQIVLLSEKYADTALMEAYISPKEKVKTVAVFHKKVKPELIEGTIRPFIEDIHRQMLQLLKGSELAFYIREKVNIRHLYESDLAIIPNEAPKVVFHFRKNEEDSCIRYSIRVSADGENIDLIGKTSILLCSEPAALIMDDRLLLFENIDLKKLKPFFLKEEVEIPSSYENTYIKTFVRNCLENNEVVAEGIDIQEVDSSKKAEMIIEPDSTNTPVIKVTLKYGENEYPLDHNVCKVVETVESEGKAGLKWFCPDKEWEKTLIAKLLRGGMEKVGPNHFTLKKNKTEYLVTKQVKNIEEWMSQHKEVMTMFDFNQ